jgi:hypothetical protein
MQSFNMKVKRLGWRTITLVALFYFVVTCGITFPLIFNFFSASPKGYDADLYQNYWNWWWIKEALFQFDNPFTVDVLYYPYYAGNSPYLLGNSLPLYFHTLQLLNGIFALPFTLFNGYAAGYNFILFISYVASGVGAFLLAYYWVRNIPASLLAGLIFSFSAIRIDAMNQSWINISSTQWLPFYVLALHCWKDYRKPRYLIWAVVTLALCAYTDWYNTTYLLLYTAYFFLVFGFPLNWWKMIKLLFPVGLGALVVVSPLLIPSILTLNSPVFLAVYGGLDKDYRGSTFLSELVLPYKPQAAVIYMTIIVVVLALLVRRQFETRRIMFYWLGFAVMGLVLVLGPKIQWERVRGAEPEGLYLPYMLFKFIPAAQIMRAPERFEIPAFLGLGMVLAIGVSALVFGRKGETPPGKRRQNPLVLASVAAGLIGSVALVTVNTAPLTLEYTPKEAWLNYLPKERKDYHILELPITRHNNFDYTRMFTQISHGRPIMGGYLSRPIFDPYRLPESPFRYFTEQLYEQDPKKEIFPAEYSQNIPDILLKLNRFEYIVIYKEVTYYEENGDFRTRTDISNAQNMVQGRIGKENLIFEDERAILYKVPDSFWQKPGGVGMLVGDGWYGVESNAEGFYRWMRQTGYVHLTVEKAGKYKVSLDALAFGGDRTLRVQANDRTVFEGRITPAPQAVEFEVEVKAGTTTLALESLEKAQTPKEIGQGGDTRLLAFLVRNLKVTL